ncbi:LptF/LptG family permease [Blattabacterium cuenoti]|uniref:LptF/LptG family permease n=1 Tax=Blattabacterium cuenoti TaxID=1653831 RepID=UPI00163C0D59|nr:LptF/LptG family permease [Blattabacterium cuenoti]
MKIFDCYIIKNSIKYFIFITISMQIICISIDITKCMIYQLYNNQNLVKNALIYYYPYLSIWIAITFSPIFLFFSVILFTSKLVKNSEITAILASGISFKRIIIPYLISATIIGFLTLLTNIYLIPTINKKKNKFHYQYLINPFHIHISNKSTAAIISNNKYVFIKNFYKKKNIGINFNYVVFHNKKLFYILKSKYILWSKYSRLYHLYNYSEIFFYDNKNKDFYKKGFYKIIKLPISPEYFYPEEIILESMTIYELNQFIKKNKKNINIYLYEYYNRIIFPITIIIFTILGFSISLKKNREIIYNIIIGVLTVFFYIFFVGFIKIVSIKYYITPYIIYVPNILFVIITILYYNKSNIYNI